MPLSPLWTFKSLFLPELGGCVLWQNVRQLNSHGSLSWRWAPLLRSRSTGNWTNERESLPVVLAACLFFSCLTNVAAKPDEKVLSAPVRGLWTAVNFRARPRTLASSPLIARSLLRWKTWHGGNVRLPFVPAAWRTQWRRRVNDTKRWKSPATLGCEDAWITLCHDFNHRSNVSAILIVVFFCNCSWMSCDRAF